MSHSRLLQLTSNRPRQAAKSCPEGRTYHIAAKVGPFCRNGLSAKPNRARTSPLREYRSGGDLLRFKSLRSRQAATSCPAGRPYYIAAKVGPFCRNGRSAKPNTHAHLHAHPPPLATSETPNAFCWERRRTVAASREVLPGRQDLLKK